MLKVILICGLILNLSFAGEAEDKAAAALLNAQKRAYVKLELDVKAKEGALDFWETELKKAERSETWAAVKGGASVLGIFPEFLIGRQLYRYELEPTTPVAQNCSRLYRWFGNTANKILVRYKYYGALTAWGAVTAANSAYAITQGNFLFFLSPPEVKELKEQVAARKAEVEELRLKLELAAQDLKRKGVDIPFEVVPPGEKPDQLEEAKPNQ